VQARRLHVERTAFWTRGRPTVGALGLTILLCLLLLLLPARRPHDWAQVAQQAAVTFPTMTPAQKLALAQELRRAAKQTGQDSEASGNLQAAANAAADDDPQALGESLQRLAQLIAAGKITLTHSADLTTSLARIEDSLIEATKTSPAPPQPTLAGTGSPLQPDSALLPPDAMTSVYNPQYNAQAASAPTAPAAAPSAGGYVSFDLAWDRARRQANDSLRQGNVPPAYRQLVRDFFLAD
jgi:hypothetical protein